MVKLNRQIFYWRWWLLKKYYDIWDKTSTDIKKEFDTMYTIENVWKQK